MQKQENIKKDDEKTKNRTTEKTESKNTRGPRQKKTRKRKLKKVPGDGTDRVRNGRIQETEMDMMEKENT